MELIPPNTHIDFIGKKKYTIWISTVAILISLGSIFCRGFAVMGWTLPEAYSSRFDFQNQWISQRFEAPWKPWV